MLKAVTGLEPVKKNLKSGKTSIASLGVFI